MNMNFMARPRFKKMILPSLVVLLSCLIFVMFAGGEGRQVRDGKRETVYENFLDIPGITAEEH